MRFFHFHSFAFHLRQGILTCGLKIIFEIQNNLGIFYLTKFLEMKSSDHAIIQKKIWLAFLHCTRILMGVVKGDSRCIVLCDFYGRAYLIHSFII